MTNITEQYWLLTIKRQQLFGSNAVMEMAQLLAHTPTCEEPHFPEVMRAIEKMGIGNKIDPADAVLSDIAFAEPGNAFRSKATTPEWDSPNLKLWIVRRSDEL